MFGLMFEAALKHYLTQLGISTEASYEQPITLLKGSGSADAVYGFGIIEYKRPGVISTPNGRKAIIEQLASYLSGKARELAPAKQLEAVKKMIGIGIDGEQVMLPAICLVGEPRQVLSTGFARNPTRILQPEEAAARGLPSCRPYAD